MNKIYPDYYGSFRCSASECRRNCCVGWDITVDGLSAKKYEEMKTPDGVTVASRIYDCGDGTKCFERTKDGRCVFLNKNNLCDVIISCGEDALCDICRLHPRFISFYEKTEEYGLGLCCEEAAKLILGAKKPVSFNGKFEGTKDEKLFREARDEYLSVFSGEGDNKTKLKRLASLCGVKMPSARMCLEKCMGFDVMEEEWRELLTGALASDEEKLILPATTLDCCFDRMAEYFICRHFAPGNYDRTDGEIIGLVLFLTVAARALTAYNYNVKDKKDFDSLCEISAMLSSEIEYDTDAPCEIMDLFE